MKIKFRALCLTALVAVLAFASVASASTSVIVADQEGRVKLLTLDETEGTVSTSDVSSAGVLKGYYFKSYNDNKGVLAIGDGYLSGFTANGTAPKWWDLLSVPTVSADRYSSMAMDSNGNVLVALRPLEDGNGAPIYSHPFDSALYCLSFDVDGKVKLTKTYPMSADIVVAWDTDVYALTSGDLTDGYDRRFVVELAVGDKLANILNNSVDITSLMVKSIDRTVVTTVDDYALIADGASIYTFERPVKKLNNVDTDLSKKIKASSTKANIFAATSAQDGKYAFALQSADAGTPQLVSMRVNDNLTWGVNTMIENISNDISTLSGPMSFDMGYDADNKVLAVIKHGTNGLIAFYKMAYDNDKWTAKRITSTDVIISKGDFYTGAVIASSTDDGKKDEPTTTTTVVDATKLTDDQKANLKNETGGEAADFVTTAVEGTGTTPDSTVTANVRSAAGTGYENATVAPVRNYTLASDGYLLVTTNPGYNAANVKVFFVPVSSSSSTSAKVAADLSENGVLLDSSYAKASGTSAYAASTEKLTAGTYTLVTATKTSSTTPEDEGSTTSSSSGGCDAGFGLWSLAALMAVSTLSKRR